MKKILISGLIAGVILFIVSYGGLFLTIRFFPQIFVEYNNPLFAADDSRSILFYTHAFIISQYPTAAMRQNILTGQVLIELAGITRRYDVNYNVLAANNDIVHLIGTRRVQFTDFKIDPPRKLGVLIRTDNDLSVVFILRVKVLV